MPKFTDDMSDFNAGTVTFSAVRPDELTETEYTLVTGVVDVTGSVLGFEDDLLQALKDIVKGSQDATKVRVENMLMRVTAFNYSTMELHGFRQVTSIDTDNDYPTFKPMGGTALYDAVYNAVESTVKYADTLQDNDFQDINAVIFVITDGEDNSSKVTAQMVKESVNKAIQTEALESIQIYLIGVNDTCCSQALTYFTDEAELTGYKSINDLSSDGWGSLVGFVSQSVSSTSQALGTGTSAPVTF